MNNIIQKLKDADLRGRGGAGFPTFLKWEMVKKSSKKEKYVICNASEGEPGVKKDLYLLENYPEKVIEGMMIAIKYLKAKKAFLYLNSEYYDKLNEKLKFLILNLPIELFKKDHDAGYIGGEESALLNHLEGKRVEPRMKPPFPSENGLWGKATLINNVETFYDVALINREEYKRKRFYTITGDCLNKGVYEFSEDMNIADILKETKNYPNFDFFVQVGGDLSGEILNPSQLEEKKASGSASIHIYSVLKHSPIKLMQDWAYFFKQESCGQCTPCREGTFRLSEILNTEKQNWELVKELLDNLADSSFCALGLSVPIPFFSFVKNVLNTSLGRKFKMNYALRKEICSVLKK